MKLEYSGSAPDGHPRFTMRLVIMISNLPESFVKHRKPLMEFDDKQSATAVDKQQLRMRLHTYVDNFMDEMDKAVPK